METTLLMYAFITAVHATVGYLLHYPRTTESKFFSYSITLTRPITLQYVILSVLSLCYAHGCMPAIPQCRNHADGYNMYN